MQKNKYFCLSCKDQNWLIECTCGCGKLLTRGSRYLIRKFIRNHNPKGKNTFLYKNGFSIINGYSISSGYSGHPNADKYGRIYTHRLIMSQYLGRPLEIYEDVHHINGNTQDNRIENLQLLSKSEHSKLTHPKIDMSNWLCKICNKKTKITKTGYEQWYGNEIEGRICNKCYIRQYRNALKFKLDKG